MRYNELDTESATTLATVAKEKGISLCGIKPEQTEADFTPSKNSYNYLKPADAILLTADLAVRGSLTSVRASPELQPTGPALTHFFHARTDRCWLE